MTTGRLLYYYYVDAEVAYVNVYELHEVMVPRDEARRTIEYERYYIIQPYFPFWGRRFDENGGNPVAEDFEYHSGTNPWQLSIDKMREAIQGI